MIYFYHNYNTGHKPVHTVNLEFKASPSTNLLCYTIFMSQVCGMNNGDNSPYMAHLLIIVARRDPRPRSASAASDRRRARVSGDGSFGPGRGNIRSRWRTRTLQSGRPPGDCRSKRGSRRAGSLPESKSDYLTICSNLITSIF